MKNLNVPMLLLAFSVILMFCLVGVAIAYMSVLFIVLFLLAGFALMGLGITLKKRNSEAA